MKFKISTSFGTFEKLIGIDDIFVELTEWEMLSLLKSLQRWNKKLFLKIKEGLIEEIKKEGYELDFETPKIEIKCPNCEKEVKI